NAPYSRGVSRYGLSPGNAHRQRATVIKRRDAEMTVTTPADCIDFVHEAASIELSTACARPLGQLVTGTRLATAFP
ncbi:hypothetical protein, partial [Bowmanella yangjiangensis]